MFTLTVDVATIANHRMFCKLTMVRCAMIYLRGVIKCARVLSLSVDSLSIFESMTEIGSLRNGDCVRANTTRCNAPYRPITVRCLSNDNVSERRVNYR